MKASNVLRPDELGTSKEVEDGNVLPLTCQSSFYRSELTMGSAGIMQQGSKL